MQLRQPGVAPQRLQAAGAVQQQALQQRRQQGSFGIGQQHIARLGVFGRALRRVAQERGWPVLDLFKEK